MAQRRSANEGDDGAARAAGGDASGSERVARRCRQLEAILARSPDVVAQFDRQLRHLYVSRSIRDISGIEPEAFIGKTNRELSMPEEEVERWDRKLNHVFETGERTSLEFDFASSDGTRVFESRLVPCYEGETVTSVLCFARDITERKRMERKLEVARARVDRILQSINEGFFALDQDEQVTFVNRAAVDLLERSREELLQARAAEVFPAAPDQPLLHEYRQAVEREETREVEAYIPTLRKWLVITVYPFEEGTSVCLHDVTERRRLERELAGHGEAERRRIGQDLRDGMGALLAGIAMMVQGLAETRKTDEAVGIDELEQIAQLASEGAERARALSQGLNPVCLDNQGLEAALRELISHAQERGGVACTFDRVGELPRMAPRVREQLYRIAQEAVNDAILHTQASCLAIRLEGGSSRLVLTVDGDGAERDDQADDGVWMRLLQYRAGQVGAISRVDTLPEGGTSVRVIIPDIDEQ